MLCGGTLMLPGASARAERAMRALYVERTLKVRTISPLRASSLPLIARKHGPVSKRARVMLCGGTLMLPGASARAERAMRALYVERTLKVRTISPLHASCLPLIAQKKRASEQA